MLEDDATFDQVTVFTLHRVGEETAPDSLKDTEEAFHYVSDAKNGLIVRKAP